MSRQQAVTCMGFDHFLSRYAKPKLHGKKPARTGVNMRDNLDQFNGWTLSVPFEEGAVNLLCCPEDLHCTGKHPLGQLCGLCEAPVCTGCNHSLSKLHRVPRFGICNDLWIGQVDDYIYAKKITYIELLCACPVHPVVLSYQLHQQHAAKLNRQKRPRMYDQRVYFQERTTCAWGNITGFMNKWESILKCLADFESTKVPHTEEALIKIVNVVLYAHRTVNGARLLGLANMLPKAQGRA
jgi:hypothetical protein